MTSLMMPDRGYCIGFLGADWWGSDPRAMAVEFRLRGHLLIERHYEDYMSTKWQSLPLRAIRRLALPWIKREYNRAVTEILAVPAADFLLVFKGMLLEAETLTEFRSRNIPCYLLYPDVSFKAHGKNIWECLPLYDCVFTTKSFHLEDEEIRGRVKSVQLVNHGFDPAVHRPIAPSPGLMSSYGCDVSFVGCWSKKKEQTVRGIIEGIPNIALRLWGPHWGQADPVVRAKWVGRGAYGDELAAIYSFSKINLGLLSEAGTGTLAGDLVTARTWQIPASGGFLLHEDNPEVRRYFEPGREVELFANERELVSKVSGYLHNDTRREQIRQAGQQRCTSASYTYASAVDAVLKYHASKTGN